MSKAISYLSIGVADIAVAEAFWVQQLGLEPVRRRLGPDPELARLWQIPADQISAQLVVRTPGAATGWLHFVQFSNSGAAVRSDARPTDLGAKNIDVNCVDMPTRVALLEAANYRFRSPPVEYEVGDVHARESQLPVHDGLNVVLIEILSGGYELAWSPRGFAAVTSFVVIVEDPDAESMFYQQVLGLDELMHHRISGAAIERAVGLPAGTTLDMRLLGCRSSVLGRMELIRYEGLKGENLFARAVPPATGILSCGYQSGSLDRLAAAAQKLGLETKNPARYELLTGSGLIMQMRSPAGLQLEIRGS